MKFNLKNRPNPHDYQYRKKVKEWFEGFEKELREILDDLKECPTEHEFLMMSFIKEILGES